MLCRTAAKRILLYAEVDGVTQNSDVAPAVSSFSPRRELLPPRQVFWHHGYACYLRPRRNIFFANMVEATEYVTTEPNKAMGHHSTNKHQLRAAAAAVYYQVITIVSLPLRVLWPMVALATTSPWAA